MTFRDTSPVTAASPEFTLPYDRLVCSVGAPFNTFGIPGVERFAFQLKEVEDALAVRGRLIDLLETAALPGNSEEERRAMCSVVVVGGRGLHSFPFQLNLSSSVHLITQLNSSMCPGNAQVEL